MSAIETPLESSLDAVRQRVATKDRVGNGVKADEMADGSSGRPPRAAVFEAPAATAEGDPMLPDLLHPEARVTIDATSLTRAVEFAFAGGDARATFDEMLCRAAIAPSDWDSACFAGELFVPDFIEHCMPPPIKGEHADGDRAFVVKVVSHPPRSSSISLFRRRVLEELVTNDATRKALFNLHSRLQDLRALFKVSGVQAPHESLRRRLDTLIAIRDVVEPMALSFEGCNSALRRINDFGKAVKATSGYQRLVELLDFDDHLASVDISLRMGADGSIRSFEILQLKENTGNAFYASPWGRVWARLSAWLSGHRFTREDLVNRWFDSVFEGIAERLPSLFQLIGDLEVYLAALALRDKCSARGLETCFAEFVDAKAEGASRHLDELFNPLLFTQGLTPVPCSISARASDISIVTGPNSGGKTRLLQALALAQMLGQSGLFVPAKRAQLCFADALFVSLEDAAEVDRREGRLGSELLRIRRLFESSTQRSMIILDELCSGTNPSEGEELFQLVISLLPELNSQVFISTHFLGLAKRLSEDAATDLSFLRVELDEDEQPTYQFVGGVAPTSLAQRTAARLGVTRSELLQLVRRHRAGD